MVPRARVIVRPGDAVSFSGREEMRRDAAVFQMGEDISLEVIDPRTLVPFDQQAVFDSVRKTGRLLVVDEAYLACGIQSEIIAAVSKSCFRDLKTAPRRLGNPGVPVPFEPSLEDAVLPTTDKIVDAARAMMAGGKRKSGG